MGLLSRLSAHFRRPPAPQPEDPRTVLDRAYAQQLDLLQQARRGLADVATARARLSQQAEDLDRQERELQHQAEQAVAAGHDDLALGALERQGRLGQQRTDLLRQHAELADQQQGLGRAVETLADRVEGLRTQLDTLSTQQTAAEAQATISGALGDVRAQVTTDLALQAVEDMTLARRAEAAALDELAAPVERADVSAQEALARLRTRHSPAAADEPDAADRPDAGGAAQ